MFLARTCSLSFFIYFSKITMIKAKVQRQIKEGYLSTIGHANSLLTHIEKNPKSKMQALDQRRQACLARDLLHDFGKDLKAPISIVFLTLFNSLTHEKYPSTIRDNHRRGKTSNFHFLIQFRDCSSFVTYALNLPHHDLCYKHYE